MSQTAIKISYIDNVLDTYCDLCSFLTSPECAYLYHYVEFTLSFGLSTFDRITIFEYDSAFPRAINSYFRICNNEDFSYFYDLFDRFCKADTPIVGNVRS